MPTFTAECAQGTAQPKGHNVGLQACAAVVSMTALLSGSGAFRLSGTAAALIMGKVPAGARVVGMYYNLGLGGDNDVSFNIGYQGSLSAFLGGASVTGQAGGGWITQGLPWDVTMSDDAFPRHRNIVVTMVMPTSLTQVGTISLITFFTNDVSAT